ncbi:SGNH/GDSL hydrolase family protein [Kribbella sp. NPDC026611]|uniref:SGNH/GDSL hydrolase family protein n=1 Tax=Kribbella sp. NPDC026611 TaxID=3154911 RepID=UPI0033F88AE3
MRGLSRSFGLAGLVVLLVAVLVQTPASAGELGGGWRAAWMTAMQPPNANPNWSQQGFSAQSLRQVIRLTAGGPALRIRITNQYGDRTVRLTGATVAKAAQGPAVEPGSVRAIRFRGAEAVDVPAGGEVASDPVALQDLSGGSRLAVTLYFAGATGPATFHEFGAAATSYRAPGDERADLGGTAYQETSNSWYFLAGVDTVAVGGGTVVAFGDSITNGFSIPLGQRYPDLLAARLAAAGRPQPVLNAGLGGNRLLQDSTCYGERGLIRFQRDVLSQPGARTALVLMGINDIGYPELPAMPCTTPNPPVTSEQLIEAYRGLITNAHSRGIRVVGATMPPFGGAQVYTEHSAHLWSDVNAWIRTSGEFDGVVDFATVLADPADPSRLDPQYDLGDHLHPNAAGCRAMADAVDLAAL